MKIEKTSRLAALLVGVVSAAATVSAAPVNRSAASPSADERAMLTKLKKLYPATAFTRVSKAPVKGLYEVTMGANVAYVDSQGRHFLFGHLFDMQTQSDLTAQRQAGADTGSGLQVERATPGQSKVLKFADLPLNDAIKQVNGNGARTLVIFSDPLCPYCRRLDGELDQLTDTTVYTFLIPILGANSRKAAETLWASAVPDRSQDLAVLDRNLQLASRHGISVTPTLVRGDGVITAGALQPAELDAWLNDAGSSAPLAR